MATNSSSWLHYGHKIIFFWAILQALRGHAMDTMQKKEPYKRYIYRVFKEIGIP